MLFEGKVTSQTVSLQAECADWVEQSLHLRVLGKQLLLPKDEGFQYFQSRSNSSVTTKVLPDLHENTTDIKQFCISGSKLVPVASPVHNSVDSSSARASDPSRYSFLEEEIFDVDGKIEEYLAFDSKEFDDERLEQKKRHLAEKSKRGIPPVSPNACIKDAVTSEVFDHIWSSVIEILEELIKKNWETKITESDKEVEKLKAVAAKLSHLPVPRVPAAAGCVPLPRSSEAQSVSRGSHFVSSQVHRFSSSFYSGLNGVMIIQAKPLQQRHVTTQENKQHSIGSNVTNSVRTKLGRIADNRVLSSSRVQLVSSRKLPSHCRLPSLTSDQPSSKLHSLRDLFYFFQHQEHYACSRVSSAVPGSAAQQPLRERTVTINQFSKPNTTQTFKVNLQLRQNACLLVSTKINKNNVLCFLGSQPYCKSFQRNPSSSRKRFQVAS
uniref:Family with sequence similarity 149 member A n=1 Tax=Nothoprocta perdicaria TaxID=30464 RepID=A0A8C7E7W3_NOTPE